MAILYRDKPKPEWYVEDLQLTNLNEYLIVAGHPKLKQVFTLHARISTVDAKFFWVEFRECLESTTKSMYATIQDAILNGISDDYELHMFHKQNEMDKYINFLDEIV